MGSVFHVEEKEIYLLYDSNAKLIYGTTTTKPTTLLKLKLYSKTVFSLDILGIFEKATLLSDIFSQYRGVFGTQLKIYDGAFWQK